MIFFRNVFYRLIQICRLNSLVTFSQFKRICYKIKIHYLIYIVFALIACTFLDMSFVKDISHCVGPSIEPEISSLGDNGSNEDEEGLPQLDVAELVYGYTWQGRVTGNEFDGIFQNTNLRLVEIRVEPSKNTQNLLNTVFDGIGDIDARFVNPQFAPPIKIQPEHLQLGMWQENYRFFLHFRGHSILVIDQDPTNVPILRNLLLEHQPQVVTKILDSDNPPYPHVLATSIRFPFFTLFLAAATHIGLELFRK